MSTRTYNRVILVVNTSKNLLLLFPLLFIKCNNFHMHIPSGNQLMLRRLMCLNKGFYLFIFTPTIRSSSAASFGTSEGVTRGNRERVSALLCCRPGRCLISNSYSCKASIHLARRPFGSFNPCNHVKL